MLLPVAHELLLPQQSAGTRVIRNPMSISLRVQFGGDNPKCSHGK
jgi:hypothetical protein